jgi:transposase-like protein
MLVVDVVPAGEDWASAEQKWISRFKELGFDLVNATIGGEGCPGLVFSEEHRRKIGQSRRGRHHSEDTRHRLSEMRRGSTLSQETKRKIAESQMGRPPTNKTDEHTIDEIRRLYSLGTNLTEIARQLGVCWNTVQKYAKRQPA